MIQIIDPNATLSADQVRDLQARSASYPFNVSVVIDGQVQSKGALEARVSSMLSGSKALVIGIAPVHRFTYVKGSVDLGLPSGSAIASAGNQFFRSGDLVSGIDAIAARAASMRTASQVFTSQTGVPIIVQQRTTSAGVWWLLGSVSFVVLAVTVYWVIRRRRIARELEAARADLQMEAAEFRGRNLEEQDWHDRMAARVPVASTVPSTPSMAPRVSYVPRVAAPASPVIVNQPAPVIIGNQSNGFDNLMAFELGEMAGRDRSDRVVERDREVVVERDNSGSSSSWGSDSSSSSSSSWGSDSSSSSSSDWGGGDSGSSGGSDSGSSGGGSDW
jgi:uncharacterized membrane protein YgcG